MLIQLMMLPMWGLIRLLINLFPNIESFPSGFGAITNIIGYGCAIIGLAQAITSLIIEPRTIRHS